MDLGTIMRLALCDLDDTLLATAISNGRSSSLPIAGTHSALFLMPLVKRRVCDKPYSMSPFKNLFRSQG